MYKLFFILIPIYMFCNDFVIDNVIYTPSREDRTNKIFYSPFFSISMHSVFSDHVVIDNSFDPNKVNTGDKICVVDSMLTYFFSEIFPVIKNPFILITRWGGRQKEFNNFLEDKKLIAWFGTNINYIHNKVHAAPIGIPNTQEKHKILFDIYNTLPKENIFFEKKRETLCYANFKSRTHFSRKSVENFSKNKDFIYYSNIRPFKDYLIDLTNSKFTISPRGFNIDCLRTWETLLMGSIPIVLSSTIDELFKDLPVLIIKDWEELTEEFLVQKYEEMKTKKYNFSKLFAQYWLDQITKVQNEYRNTQQ